MSIAENLQRIRASLKDGVSLVAVSKYHSAQEITQAYHAGQRLFAESKVQDLVTKAQALPSDIQWHMIGHLQRNKVKYIAPFISLIHSVDSLRLLSEIDKQASKHGRVIPCLLQVHVAQEQSKFGFAPQQIIPLLPELAQFPHVRIHGIMGMASFTQNTQQITQEFELLHALFQQIKQLNLPFTTIDTLSMGMSGDYSLAMDCGSTLVRIGSLIFEE